MNRRSKKKLYKKRIYEYGYAGYVKKFIRPKKQILTCPFCGTNPTYTNNFLELGLHVILCENKKCKVHPHAIGKTKEEAKENWGRIPGPYRHRGQIHEL